MRVYSLLWHDFGDNETFMVHHDYATVVGEAIRLSADDIELTYQVITWENGTQIDSELYAEGKRFAVGEYPVSEEFWKLECMKAVITRDKILELSLKALRAIGEETGTPYATEANKAIDDITSYLDQGGEK